MPSSTSLMHIVISRLCFILALMILASYSQSATLTRTSTVYVVKFFKATSDQIQNLSPVDGNSKRLLTEIQFLEKLVRNTTGVLNQAVFYVNFTVNSTVNFSKSSLTNSNNLILGASTINSNGIIKDITITTQLSQQNNNTNGNKSVNSSQNTMKKLNQNSSNSNNPVESISTLKNNVINSTLSNLTQKMPISTLKQTNSSALPEQTSKNKNKSNETPIITINQNNFQGNKTDPYPYKNLISQITSIITVPKIVKKQTPKNYTNLDFPNIVLYHQVPINFTKNQLYKFSGEVISTSNLFQQTNQTIGINFNFVNVIFSNIKSNQQIKCIQKITTKNLKFQISCKLKMTGQFVLSIFAGQAGYSSQTIRRINEIPPTLSTSGLIPPQPQFLSLQIADSDLFINWGSVAALTKVTFTQNINQIQYLLSNYHNRFRVPHYDFINFEEGETKVTISHANSVDSTLFGISSFFGNKMQIKFNAVSHMHSNNQQDYYTIIPQLPQRLKVGQQFIFTAVFNTNIQSQIFVINPYHQLKKLYFYDGKIPLNDIIVPPNTNLTLSIRFSDAGNNLIEINQDSGLAIVNQVIYVGDVYPLMPDYHDLKIQSLIQKTDTVAVLTNYLASTAPRHITIQEPPKIASIQQKRKFLLKLLNLLRTQQIINPIYIDDKLTQIAQDHSDDMRKFNYFSHTNNKNEGPAQRAKRFSFNGAIGENIAQSDSLIQAHLSLQRSAAHFENSISRVWTRVGIGINQTLFGQYLITFQFSSRDIIKDPLSSNELAQHQRQLIDMLQKKYPNLIEYNDKVSGLIIEWMNKERILPLNQFLISKGITRQLIYTTIKFAYYPQFVAQLQKSTSIFGEVSKYKQVAVGLGINKNDFTVMQCYFVFIV